MHTRHLLYQQVVEAYLALHIHIHMVSGQLLHLQQRQKKVLRAAHVQDVVIMKQQLFQLLEKIHLLHLTHRYQEMQRYITLQNQEQQVTSIVLQEAQQQIKVQQHTTVLHLQNALRWSHQQVLSSQHHPLESLHLYLAEQRQLLVRA